MYVITQTRSDLTYPVSTFSRFSTYLSKENTSAIKLVNCYLQKTQFLSLTYKKSCKLKLVGYTDSD